MSTIRIKLLKTDSEFIEAASNKIPDVNGHDWFHLPFWYKKVGEGVYEEYRFEDLPQELKKRILDIRK